jgi:hypothetical protein
VFLGAVVKGGMDPDDLALRGDLHGREVCASPQGVVTLPVFGDEVCCTQSERLVAQVIPRRRPN